MKRSAFFRRSIAFARFVTLAGLVVPSTGLAEPKPKRISYYYDSIEQSLVRPLERTLDLSILVRTFSGSRREAANVDDHDQVQLPSTWWQPRVGHRLVSVEQMLKGPGPGAGPAPPPWTVTRAKTQGITPGFQIKDRNGDRFLLKFDPPEYQELATGADVVTTYLYWAAGYNVPDNAIVTFRPDDLVFTEESTFEDPTGRKQPITRAFLDRVLERVHRNADDTFRAMASRILAGKHLGEWEYQGRRKDDPEDLIPHQHRREIRGLYTINAWANHADGSARNTLDLWVTDGGRSFVRHHLIDFGACLGSASIKPHGPRGGHEYLLDYGAASTSLVSLGLLPSAWEHAEDPGLPSIGFFESRTFDPERWRPFLPNPAFDQRTERDIVWGARIVAGFSDELIRAAVERGRYSDPRAIEYLARTLIERRDKIARRWLSGRDGRADAGP